jgi:hypothetical protein
MSKTEPAWPGGPMRRLGTGSGLATVYVCSQCLTSVGGVYRAKRLENGPGAWLCAACRTQKTFDEPMFEEVAT